MATKDEHIKKDIVDQLYWDPRVDSSEVSVEVKNGSVVLKGSVPTYFARSAAYESAFRVEGVVEIDNRIKVLFPESYTPPTDDEIRHRVRKHLDDSTFFDMTEIMIEVEEGIVTITGTVDEAWKKQYAENSIINEPGIVAVSNHLAVVPSDDFVDKEIAEDVIRAIDRNAYVDPNEVNVVVNNGVVTLSGTVLSTFARRAAYDAALHTPGVKEIRDRITVEPI